MNEFIEKMKELGAEEALYPSGYEDAVVGIVYRHPDGYLFILSSKKILEMLIDNGMSQQEAIEYFDFNMKNAYLGAGSPVYLEDEEE